MLEGASEVLRCPPTLLPILPTPALLLLEGSAGNHRGAPNAAPPALVWRNDASASIRARCWLLVSARWRVSARTKGPSLQARHKLFREWRA